MHSFVTLRHLGLSFYRGDGKRTSPVHNTNRVSDVIAPGAFFGNTYDGGEEGQRGAAGDSKMVGSSFKGGMFERGTAGMWDCMAIVATQSYPMDDRLAVER